MKNLSGKLIAIDMYSCAEEQIADAKVAEGILRKGCEENSMAPREIICCQEDGNTEYSLSAICKQGHVTLHIYPEIGLITADVFSCSKDADQAAMGRYLRDAFDADKSKITVLDRVDFGSESDMKPSRQSKIKFTSRTKNLGGKLKKMMLKPRSI